MLQLQVQRRTEKGHGFSHQGSHVKQYGDKKLSNESLYSYMGTNPANDNDTSVEYGSSPSTLRVVNQRDATLLHFWHKVFCLSIICYYYFLIGSLSNVSFFLLTK